MGADMAELTWVHEPAATWDADKARIVGGAEEGIFAATEHTDGQLLPGDWWHVERDGQVVGYGWMDVVWGDGEMLLAVDPDARGNGVGGFILEQLAISARERGLRRIYNVVRPTHPHHHRVSAWLSAHGFTHELGDARLVRKV
jgi:N-acetylglutamate synthase-like GNAT family acetyltransferase